MNSGTVTTQIVEEAAARLATWVASWDAGTYARYCRPYKNPGELRDDIAIVLDALNGVPEGPTS